MKSEDIVEDNFEYIKEKSPNVVVESENGYAIDFNALKQELSDVIVDDTKEKYQLTWPGKKEAIVTANTQTTKTLRPLREKSVNFDMRGNILATENQQARINDVIEVKSGRYLHKT